MQNTKDKIIYDGIIVHFGELWLKGRNRHDFINTLIRNIKAALGPELGSKLIPLRDRLIIDVHTERELKSCKSMLSNVFGISWYAPFIKCESNMDAIVEKSNSLFHKGENVRVEPHRSNKSVAFNTMDIVSAFIKDPSALKFVPEKFGKKTLYIEVLDKFSILHKEKIQGLGGLPIGSSGKAIVLLSGGIDSPVAAYYAMKRGLEPIYVHFYALQNIEELKASKMPAILEMLLKYSNTAKVYYIPIHMFQIAAMKESQKYEVLLFKRFIFKTAQIIAEKENAKIIVTGESLGQVSSQTAENLIATSNGIKCLFFRPLLGLDKQEIINVSKELGIYAKSILPYKDACSLRSKNPVTRISANALDSIYNRNGLEELSELSISKSDVRYAKPA